MSAVPPFVHLHCHTDYSLLDGACETKRLMQTVAEQGMPAVAMTDHGNMFGAVEFYNAAKERGINPIIGCEVYTSPLGQKDRSNARSYNHLVLLCENQDGYRNLIQLVSSGYLDGFYNKPRIDKDLLARHSKGIIALSACLKGDIAEHLMEDRYQEAKKLAYEYQDIFGKNNFFLELQNHGLDQDKKILPMLYRMGRETGIPLVATNDAHYLKREDARAHEIMLCIQTGKTVSDPSRMKWDSPDFYLKSRDEMMQIFGEVEEALDRTWDIAQRCKVKLEQVKDPFPRFDIPQPHSIDSYFEFVTREGFERRRARLEALQKTGQLRQPLEVYYERLDREIKMIQQMQFSGYFLVVWDFIHFSKTKGIPVGPGRGSAAGSLVSYALSVTDVDPLQYGLLFERFLNPERVSMPDIDIDFCTNRRGEVIQYVTEKYGRDFVAQIITFGTLGARAAIKDVGRVLDMSFGDVEKLTKLVPSQPLNIKLKEAFAMEPGFEEAAKADPRVREVLDTAVRLEGMARNAGMHAAGVVISSTPLKELVPLYKTNRDEVVTQYDMVGMEKLGLLKMDFLGLTTLTILHEAVRLIEVHQGVKLELEDLPLDDKKTYGIFSNGYTSGIFQFESPGMRDVLRRYQPERIEDLTALNALYRPGPIKGGVIDDFIDRKHGRKQVIYDVKEIQPILEETYGIMLYQEQVMQISQVLAGYSLGEADILRRAMGKKKKEEMDAQRERFLKGASDKGFSPKKAEKIFDLMAQFAEYGFNKSHSAAYALLAYLTAYLKAHYPIEFMSALLTSETGNTAKVVKYINECRDMEISVLPPDINQSALTFTPAGDAIRFGLGAIKNVGAAAVNNVVEARVSGGPFTSLASFCERVDLTSVNRRMIESFIKAGAMDSLPGNRAQLFATIDGAMETGQRAMRDRMSGQSGLFGEMLAEAPEEQPLPKLNDWTIKEKLTGEKEMLGFYVTGHPLDEFRDKVKERSTRSSSELEDLKRGDEVSICGVITGLQRRRNKDGKPWASFQLEDWYGNADCMCFFTAYENLQADLQEDVAVLIRGTALPEENAPSRISVKEVTSLANVRMNLPRLISIKVPVGTRRQELDRATALQELFGKKQGEAEVRLRLEKPRDFSVILDIQARVRPDKEFCAEVERICGPQAMEVLAD
ncbi:MAG TPA: DNA polymerase III subunit alpha [Bryobacteraceae bacterium]|nr:DNA polymerase III subunit alpha [Bryobacteraceae bacterium]